MGLRPQEASQSSSRLGTQKQLEQMAFRVLSSHRVDALLEEAGIPNGSAILQKFPKAASLSSGTTR